MNLLKSIRQHGFWLSDSLKGGLIKRHYNDINWAFKNPEQAQKLATERLNKLLHHACQTTEFYKDFINFNKLSDFPVIQKGTIKAKFDDFVSNVYDKKSLTSRTTSGSYGVPFAFLLTKDKYYRQIAEILYFNEWAGYELGMKFAQFRIYHKSWLTLFLQNTIKIDPSKIIPEWLGKNRKILLNNKMKFIICYPCTLMPLAHYCEEKGDKPDDFSLVGIISSAEPIHENIRRTFERVFGCPVFDRYATLELGVVAHECNACKVNHLNFASYFVELLSFENDKPVEKGQPGRIIVTDLFSYAMPLIRYDIGDIASWVNEGNLHKHIPSLSNIEGRYYEIIYSTSGEMIIPGAIALIVVFYGDENDIIQWQFIQETKKDYLLKLITKPSYKGEQSCKERIIKLLGKDARLRIEYVDSIPPLPSGKRPVIFNKIHNQKN